MADRAILPVPPNVRDAMALLIAGLPADEGLRFKVRVAIREAYADGYGDGYAAGFREGRDDIYDARRAAEAVAEKEASCG